MMTKTHTIELGRVESRCFVLIFVRLLCYDCFLVFPFVFDFKVSFVLCCPSHTLGRDGVLHCDRSIQEKRLMVITGGGGLAGFLLYRRIGLLILKPVQEPYQGLPWSFGQGGEGRVQDSLTAFQWHCHAARRLACMEA